MGVVAGGANWSGFDRDQARVREGGVPAEPECAVGGQAWQDLAVSTCQACFADLPGSSAGVEHPIVAIPAFEANLARIVDAIGPSCVRQDDEVAACQG